ncbi:M24 family metallopeptidase [Novosphingopyxis sp. YJ-S2-01]|uniref:M24 family metallopeptidase n=1 Tax=Novosphingopyxis sp. YJ-S2-01 TaxID=2794021 RepID=UPI001E2D6863|nr:Xaa-Pro peptidase family protein [Novosphingopyxis sp. YJ-S2-01]
MMKLNMMRGSPALSRRRLMGSMALGSAALASAPLTGLRAQAGAAAELEPITGGAIPIGRAERAERLKRAQALMAANDIGAILIEPGASLVYFTGVRWWRSERLTAAIIPASGDPIIVTPFFERPSVAESLGIDADIRVWQEDESPTRLVAQVLTERGLADSRIGIEETVRFFASDGLAQALPKAPLVSAAPVVRGCRMRKTPAEIALMQIANDVTLAAYRYVYPRIEEGMGPARIGAMMDEATRALGGRDPWSLILLGEASAYPHGSGKPQRVERGGIVLMDCGCSVEDYQSDISRTFVFGPDPTAEQARVWNEVARGQQVAFDAAQLGAPAGSVDDAVRAYYVSLGYGPRYELPGLSHRTGHGIGMEGHEPVNLVHGEQTTLAEGMCFSNEPGLYAPGQFGVRLEDCFHMTATGPEYFTQPPPSIDQPFG